jgi:hypothetical protein
VRDRVVEARTMKTDGSEINYPLRYYPVCESGEIYSGPGLWSVLHRVRWDLNRSLPSPSSLIL